MEIVPGRTVPGRTGQAQLTLPVGGRGPLSVAVNPTTGEIYVGDTGDGTVRSAPPVDASVAVQGR